MKSLLVSVIFLALSQNLQAETGNCLAMGRVGGEDKVCARFNNTDAATCKKADGWAWCNWDPKAKVRGTGPLAIECTNENGEMSLYRANRIVYAGLAEKKSLVAIGFGPNRQDDGIAHLEGECQILPVAAPVKTK